MSPENKALVERHIVGTVDADQFGFTARGLDDLLQAVRSQERAKGVRSMDAPTTGNSKNMLDELEKCARYTAEAKTANEGASRGQELARMVFKTSALLQAARAEERGKGPTREEVARQLAEHFGAHVWDEMAADRADLKRVARLGCDYGQYDINEATKADCFDAASDILALFQKDKSL